MQLLHTPHSCREKSMWAGPTPTLPLPIEVPSGFENLNFLFLAIPLFAKGILTYTPI